MGHGKFFLLAVIFFMAFLLENLHKKRMEKFYLIQLIFLQKEYCIGKKVVL